MSSLAARFFMRMHKRAESTQGETTPGSEVSSEKSPKQSGQDEEAQKSLAAITVGFLKQAFDALLALEGASQDAYREACASLEDGAPTGGPPDANGVVG